MRRLPPFLAMAVIAAAPATAQPFDPGPGISVPGSSMAGAKIGGAAAGLAVTPPGERLRADAGPIIAEMRARATALVPDWRDGPPAAAQLPAPRTAVEDGRTVVRLTAIERARIGLVAESRPAVLHRQELTAYGSVLDLARITELTNSYAGAVAARAALEPN